MLLVHPSLMFVRRAPETYRAVAHSPVPPQPVGRNNLSGNAPARCEAKCEGDDIKVAARPP